MATLPPGQPVTVDQPVLLVENDLAAGQHRFQLVVVDDGGLESAPAELLVTVRRLVRPRDPIERPDIRDRIERVERVGRVVNPDIIGRIRRPP
jgi:hypothetical protein